MWNQQRADRNAEITRIAANHEYATYDPVLTFHIAAALTALVSHIPNSARMRSMARSCRSLTMDWNRFTREMRLFLSIPFLACPQIPRWTTNINNGGTHYTNLMAIHANVCSKDGESGRCPVVPNRNTQHQMGIHGENHSQIPTNDDAESQIPHQFTMYIGKHPLGMVDKGDSNDERFDERYENRFAKEMNEEKDLSDDSEMRQTMDSGRVTIAFGEIARTPIVDSITG